MGSRSFDLLRKTDTPLQIKRKMKRAAAAAARHARKTKGFPAYKFVGKLKGLFGDAREYQKRVRDEWKRCAAILQHW